MSQPHPRLRKWVAVLAVVAAVLMIARIVVDPEAGWALVLVGMAILFGLVFRRVLDGK